ncbi:DUF1642 domain-containing protein [Streptococcus suis]|nr:DUF1642 domain-containing protein [Streptococcus suis]
MNKQEVIKELMSKSREIIFGDDENVYLSRKRTIELVSQIHEPPKVVVPKFVAEWIEHCKQSNLDLDHAMRCTMVNNAETGVEEWIYENQETFARAWLDGYEIEQEKLYTVEIPNPNADGYSIVLGRKEGKVRIKQVWSTTWKMNCSNQLTESEIKKDFEWAWQWAEPVEVE